VAGDHPFQHGSQPRATGHLWQQRYQRVLVEPDSQALSAMACSIEMNPVRAGLVKDPKDNRRCGYGQALAKVSQAQAGIVHLYKADGKIAEVQGRTGLFRRWSGTMSPNAIGCLSRSRRPQRRRLWQHHPRRVLGRRDQGCPVRRRRLEFRTTYALPRRLLLRQRGVRQPRVR